MTRSKAGSARRKAAKKKGGLFIISAPSGAGKTTLANKLSARFPLLKHSVSYTSRSPRKGEINNVHYTFISKNKFQSMIKKGEFVEWAVVHGNLYGTAGKRLSELRNKGYNVLLDIDTQGAVQLRKSIRDAVYVFILPPSMKILSERLRGRRSDLTEDIKRRLENAKNEILSYRDYDYVVVNDDISKALKELESIIISAGLRTDKVDSNIINDL